MNVSQPSSKLPYRKKYCISGVLVAHPERQRQCTHAAREFDHRSVIIENCSCLGSEFGVIERHVIAAAGRITITLRAAMPSPYRPGRCGR